MAETKIDIDLKGISTLLKNYQFQVPPYQRSYAWENEHVEALLNDVNQAIQDEEHEYFLGSVVVTGPSPERRFEVVDGQQRLATTSLLIAAIKDKYRELGDSQTERATREEFLAKFDRRTKDYEPRLALNEIDNELYQKLIDDPSKIEPSQYLLRSGIVPLRPPTVEVCAGCVWIRI